MKKFSLFNRDVFIINDTSSLGLTILIYSKWDQSKPIKVIKFRNEVRVKFFKPINFNCFKLPLVDFLKDDGSISKRFKRKTYKKVACFDGENFIYST
jgi:hypothetical protein